MFIDAYLWSLIGELPRLFKETYRWSLRGELPRLFKEAWLCSVSCWMGELARPTGDLVCPAAIEAPEEQKAWYDFGPGGGTQDVCMRGCNDCGGMPWGKHEATNLFSAASASVARDIEAGDGEAKTRDKDAVNPFTCWACWAVATGHVRCAAIADTSSADIPIELTQN